MPHVTMTMDEYHQLLAMVGEIKEGEGAHEEAVEAKRSRKKTSRDRKMSTALRQANDRGRKRNGDLRKGWNQSRIMKLAHKLAK
jgi:hypothetical protein